MSIAPAARYRELRVNRTIYLLGTLLLLAPWAMWLQSLWSELNIPAWVLAESHTTVAGMMRQSILSFTQNGQTTTIFGLVMAAAIGLALFAYDRFAGGLLFSLEGPLRRREVFLAKAYFGTASIMLPVVLGTAGTLVFAAVSQNPALTGPILLRGLYTAAGEFSLFATALAMGGAMGTVFSAGVTVTWAALPSLLQSLLTNLFLVPTRQVVTMVPGGARTTVTMLKFAAPWISNLAATLSTLSQPGWYYGWSLGAVLVLIAWFLLWAVLMLWLGLGWWQRAPFERLRDGVFFPFLWNLYEVYLGLASGLVLTNIITHGQVYGLGWAAIYLGTSVAGWLFWRFIVRRRRSGATLRMPLRT